MRFWDSSAILPLIVVESTSLMLSDLLSRDDTMVVWWGSGVECHSALNRRLRDGSLSLIDLQTARLGLQNVIACSYEVLPTESLRILAQRLLAVHPLRAADSLQLAAALIWADSKPVGRELVCLDSRLSTAARLEGFSVTPHEA